MEPWQKPTSQNVLHSSGTGKHEVAELGAASSSAFLSHPGCWWKGAPFTSNLSSACPWLPQPGASYTGIWFQVGSSWPDSIQIRDDASFFTLLSFGSSSWPFHSDFSLGRKYHCLLLFEQLISFWISLNYLFVCFSGQWCGGRYGNDQESLVAVPRAPDSCQGLNWGQMFRRSTYTQPLSLLFSLYSLLMSFK